MRQRSTQGRGGGGLDDAIVQVLTDHQHVIDCIAWAPTESCRTIDQANYSGHNDENEEVNGDADNELRDQATTNSASDT